jgi:Rrf2 family iron-sulfur cluster assembly transcriptional regulator
MTLLTRKDLLAIAAVVDVALHPRGKPASAKSIAARHLLPPRHLEPVLQALVHHGILKGVRGPGGGYDLAREKTAITADEIVKAAASTDQSIGAHASSLLLQRVVMPAISQAENAFAAALARINVEDLVRQADIIRGLLGL